LNLLSPRCEFWEGKAAEWIYRGQDGDYPLLPKAYRNEGEHYERLGFHVEEATHEKPLWSVLGATGQDFLKTFREILDRTGLPVPTEAPKPFNKEPETRTMDEPDRAVYPQLALAQHLGLPTPLLDWTHRAYVAAYFAVPKFDPKEKNVVVWALRTPFLKPKRYYSTALYYSEDCSMALKTAPRASNPNLHAQSGIFTVIQGEKAPTLDVETFVRGLKSNEPDKYGLPPFPLLHKIVLPANYSGRLLKLLVDEGIDGAAMFPGYDGVARAMAERVIWYRDKD
jgi:hypothetical protein